jgi:hypothetical protein
MYYLSHLQLLIVSLLLLPPLTQSQHVNYTVLDTCEKSTSYLSRSRFLVFPGTLYDKATKLGYATDTENVVAGFLKNDKVTTITFNGFIRSGNSQYDIHRNVCDMLPHYSDAMFIILCDSYEVYYHRSNCVDIHIRSPMPNITGFYFSDSRIHWHWRCVTATQEFFPESCIQTVPQESDIYYQKRPKQREQEQQQEQQQKKERTPIILKIRQNEYSYKKKPMSAKKYTRHQRQLLQITEATNLTCVQNEYWNGKTCAPCPVGFSNSMIFHRALTCEQEVKDATVIVVFVGLGSLNIFISLVIISSKHLHTIEKYKFF